MTACSIALVLSALVALGFALVLLLRSLNPADACCHRRAHLSCRRKRCAMQMNPRLRPAARDCQKPRRSAADCQADAASAVGQAQGAIHFEKKPAERDTKGESIDINVQSALGVWQPDGRVMRVLLLESQPAAGSVGADAGRDSSPARRMASRIARPCSSCASFRPRRRSIATSSIAPRSSSAMERTRARRMRSAASTGAAALPWPDPNLPPDRHPTLHAPLLEAKRFLPLARPGSSRGA